MDIPSLRDLLFGPREGLRPGSTFDVTRGAQVVFGSDPMNSPETVNNPNFKSAKLVAGVGKDQLSRAAVKFGIDQSGNLWMMKMTNANVVTIHDKGANVAQGEGWHSTELKTVEVDSIPRKLSPEAVIDIKTQNGTVIRLEPKKSEGQPVADNDRILHQFTILKNPKNKPF